MDKKRVSKIIARFIQALKSNGVETDKIILYGSHVENRQHEGSDIDLIIISKDFDGKSYWERIDILSDAIYDVFAPIEAIAMTPREWEKGDSLIHHYATTLEMVK